MIPNKYKPDDKSTVTWLQRQSDDNFVIKEETQEDDVLFCKPELSKKILELKSNFDDLDPRDIADARRRTNPFDLGRGSFLNRCGMKMANIDYIFNHMFTTPLLYFADLCGGPGGFAEYMLLQRHCKGFGITLKGPNDYHANFLGKNKGKFQVHYGSDGDVCNLKNILSFRDFVKSQTDQKGVDVTLADGAFSVDGNENNQEKASGQLFLCQCLCALLILRKGGHFICKVFDLFTPFSVGLVYCMYGAFEKISIVKPASSRPANSEKYLVCYGFNNDGSICDYLLKVYSSQSSLNVQSDKIFYKYILKSNNAMAQRQIFYLKQMIRAITNKTWSLRA